MNRLKDALSLLDPSRTLLARLKGLAKQMKAEVVRVGTSTANIYADCHAVKKADNRTFPTTNGIPRGRLIPRFHLEVLLKKWEGCVHPPQQVVCPSQRVVSRR